MVSVSSCYRMRSSKGGGQIKQVTSRKVNASDILLPPGYKIEAVAQGLTFPGAVTFDDKNNLYVLETGYSYGEVWLEPKLIQISGDEQKIIATGKKNGPWTDVMFYQGNFYVSEGGHSDGGKILRISPDGEITTLAESLPSWGDHHTNSIVIKDGYIYFGQGTATNSGIVGPDNKEYGWLTRKPDFHDIPCRDIVLSGQNFETENLLGETGNKVLTGAFSPYGKKTTAGQVIKGQIPCSGAVLRLPIAGGSLEVVAWGFRNPYGLAVSPDGKIYAAENAFDDRGSRPVWGAGDVLWEVKENTWFGWPDFAEGKAIQTTEEFKPPKKDNATRLLQQYPNEPPKPVAIFGVHSSACGFDFVKGGAFGHEGEAFVAEFGDMAPEVGKVLKPVGFKIVRVDVSSGIIRDFAVNKGKRNAPASKLKTGGLERPLSVTYNEHTASLYIADFGIMKMSKAGSHPQQKTGVIWKITRQ